MRNLILIILLTLTGNLKSQIDLSFDASLIGIYSTGKISYPIYNKFVVGGSFAYNIYSQENLTERFGLVLGYKFDDYMQFEVDLGFIGGYDINKVNKMYVFHADVGMKGFFYKNVFGSVQVALPGFLKVGLGIRFRPLHNRPIYN